MSRPTTPSFNIVGVSQEGLNFIDEFEELMEDFDATPRPDETRISSSRSESACSVTVLECKQLLQPRPVESRSGSATSKRPLTAAYSSPVYTPFPSRPSTSSTIEDDILSTTSRRSTKTTDFPASSRSKTYELVPTNDSTQFTTTSAKNADQPKLSTFIEMAVLKAATDSRKSANLTLRKINENRTTEKVEENYLSKVKRISLYLGLVVLLFGIFIAFLANSLHVIKEGFVGIYFLNGALMDTYTLPGVHLCIPFITRVEKIGVRMATETVPPILVSTNDGVATTFNDVQVLVFVEKDSVLSLVKRYGKVFRETLIHDRISEELRVFCANRSVDEIFIRKYSELVPTIRRRLTNRLFRLNVSNDIRVEHLTIPKPEVPSNVADRYQNLQVHWMNQRYEVQRQATEAIKKETENLGAVADAETRKAVSAIDTEKAMIQKSADKNISSLNDVIVRDRERSFAEISKYKKDREAEANKLLFANPAYLDLMMSKNLAPESKVYFSGRESLLGALLKEIMDA